MRSLFIQSCVTFKFKSTSSFYFNLIDGIWTPIEKVSEHANKMKVKAIKEMQVIKSEVLSTRTCC